MKKYTNEELQKILGELNDGKIFCGIDKYNRGVGIIYKIHNDYWNEDYIGWTYAGSSANKFTIDGLKFVLEDIFEKCSEITEAQYSDYYINYVPIDKKYKEVDFNREHQKEYI